MSVYPQAPLPGEGSVTASQPWDIGIYSFSFKARQERPEAKMQMSDFRVGTVTLAPQGLTIDGKAVLPSSTRTLIIVLSIVTRIGILFAAVLLEYVIRLQKKTVLSWEEVESIVLDPVKQRVSLVHRVAIGKPDKQTGIPKTALTALTFMLEGMKYAEFEQAARRFKNEQTSVGKIVPATPWWVFLIVIGIFIGAIVVLMLLSGNRP